MICLSDQDLQDLRICRMRLTHGSVFTGTGGFEFAAQEEGYENLFHTEINGFGRRVLKYYWPKSVSYHDITKTDYSVWRRKLTVLSGGFPCQDASQANSSAEGKQGLSGNRTGLFFEFCRAIDESRPEFVVAENVANILKVNGGKDFSRILSELSGMGYNAEWRVCTASEKGAPHQRARLYLVAYSNSIRLQKDQTFIPYVQEKASQKPWYFAGTTIQNFRGGQMVG